MKFTKILCHENLELYSNNLHADLEPIAPPCIVPSRDPSILVFVVYSCFFSLCSL